MNDFPLGRREPTTWVHVEKYPLRTIAPLTVDVAERTLNLPTEYVTWYDQGVEGACVGFAASWTMSVMNRQRYDARWLYREAQLIDEWADTPPSEGTSVRAAFDILRDKGHRRMWGPVPRPMMLANGIAANRWAVNVDEIRTAIQGGTPVVFGINWYSRFDQPEQLPNKEFWIGRGNDFGYIRGGHAICAYAVSDKRQAVRLVNSWGVNWKRSWLPYNAVTRLLNESGECGLIVDR
jgi:hypothetical protein